MSGVSGESVVRPLAIVRTQTKMLLEVAQVGSVEMTW